MKFANVFEQNFSTEIFKVSKVVRKFPQPVYELEDLRGNSIEGQFLREDLTPFIITKNTSYKIDKIPGTKGRKCICEYLFHWRGFLISTVGFLLRVSKVMNQFYITL
jgi:hypothetical protein